MFIGYNAGNGTMYFATHIEGNHIGSATNSVPSYWFTNLDIDKTHEPLILTKNYKGHEDRYPKYDNYDAINCDKVTDIPKDYYGVIGVPITFLAQYCPEQFRIVGLDRYTAPKEVLVGGRLAVNGKPKYARILIERKN